MKQLTTDDFKVKVFNYEASKEWQFEGDKPCIVDFYADWCGPCKITSPIIDELAKEYAGKVNFYKVNTDQERELAAVFRIQSIPTFIYCPKDGQFQISSGIPRTAAETKQMFVKMIDEILLN